MKLDWPLAQFAFSLLEILQLLHAVDLLLDERRFVLPRVVDVRPALPLDEVLHLACFLSLLEAGVRIAVIQSIVVSSTTAHSYNMRIMTKKVELNWLEIEDADFLPPLRPNRDRTTRSIVSALFSSFSIGSSISTRSSLSVWLSDSSR